jgi:hypothetical protein
VPNDELVALQLGRALDSRLLLALLRFKVLVHPHVLGQLLEKGNVRGVGQQTVFVQNGQNAARLLLNQIADNAVVKVFDGRPGNALARVLLLLGAQRELDKVLLQLFVAPVDEKLLERVVVENLKAVNVQHAQRHLLAALFGGNHCLVDLEHDPVKEAAVQRLGKRVARRRRVHQIQRRVDGLRRANGARRQSRVQLRCLATEQKREK